MNRAPASSARSRWRVAVLVARKGLIGAVHVLRRPLVPTLAARPLPQDNRGSRFPRRRIQRRRCNAAAFSECDQSLVGRSIDGHGELPRSSRARRICGRRLSPTRSWRGSPTTCEHCPACEAALETLDSLADPLLSGLRRLTTTDGSEAEPVPPQLIAAVRSGGPPSGGASAWLSAEEGDRRLGKFELLEQLGVGSFGYVFRARDAELGRIVAIKIPRAGSLATPKTRRGSCARHAVPRSSSTPASSRSTRPARPRTGRFTWSRNSSRGRRWRAT